MHYTNGNYEAFVTSRKPKGVDEKSAYIIGGGLAGLAAAVFLIRDGYMKGNKIHIFEELSLSGGSLDGQIIPHEGFVVRGGREMENHFETLWDLFRSIPSLEQPGQSVLDEIAFTENDLVFVTNGSITESSTQGDQKTPAPITRQRPPLNVTV